MVRQYRYALKEELWELPAGKLEKDEDPFEMCIRDSPDADLLLPLHATAD